ncbi:hypothetical protein [Candidatus Magnetaquicoccus inordinatus]|uniref:hypothetical protein n=1 Tax=Candidatus Magnetaquicoccus inordinatus TaxID=2496818 RepID=UPI00102AD94B|nr:hypothetical protein [Candidatus Magnetaquicoccus inordinatus]
MPRRLVCAISGHGYGHLAQSAALLNILPEWLSDLQIHILSPLPLPVLHKQLRIPFSHSPLQLDVGLLQSDALTVDLPATRNALRALHAQWPNKIKQTRQLFASLHSDLLLADIPYLALAAAATLLPSVAIASLSWDAVLAAYFFPTTAQPTDPELLDWWQSMQSAYASATLALLPTPAIHPHPFPVAHSIAPLTLPGQRHPKRLRSLLHLSPQDQRPLVLLSLGGIPAHSLPIPALQHKTECHWLIDAPLEQPPPHLHPVSALQPHLAFSDLAASVDAVISKPGYNTAVAATLHQLPFLYIPRGTFPDEPFIISWAKEFGRAEELSPTQFYNAEWLEPLFALWQQPAKPAPSGNGAQEAAAHILPLLR